MKIIGVTGNTGSGKSTVSELLRKLGAYVVDADSIAHEVILADKPAYCELLTVFGREILGDAGEIDRKKLGSIVFSDELQRAKLIDITHRYIIEEMKSKAMEAKEKTELYSYVVLDAPLLIEAGLHLICDVVWVVFAEESRRLERIMIRDSITEEQAAQRIKSQTAFEDLKKYADSVIVNTDDLSKLTKQIDEMLKELNQ